MSKGLRRGISPVIATVIIVAVAIAIAIAVAGWLFGLWGGFAGGTTQVAVTNIRVEATGANSGNIDLYYVNSGSGSDQILKVEISNGTHTVAATQVTTGLPAGFDDDAIIEANEKGWVRYSFTGLTVNPGDSVTIRVYLEKSGTVTIPATVQP